MRYTNRGILYTLLRSTRSAAPCRRNAEQAPLPQSQARDCCITTGSGAFCQMQIKLQQRAIATVVEFMFRLEKKTSTFSNPCFNLSVTENRER